MIDYKTNFGVPAGAKESSAIIETGAQQKREETRRRVQAEREGIFLSIVKECRIRTCFQPIVDLFSGRIIGYETLSRGVPPFESPAHLFAEARSSGMLWELEMACRTRAFESIASLSGEIRNCMFFVNVSPNVFSDPRFRTGFTLEQLRSHGISHDQIVIEITEDGRWKDFEELESLVTHYRRQGLKIALDDFGSGHSSLVTLIAVSPQFIKLDKEIIRDIHRHSYKQMLVKSMVSFAAGVSGSLVAEGIETWDELQTIARLGVRYAQGFLLARPAFTPPEVDKPTRHHLSNTMHNFNYPKVELEETISRLVIRGATARAGALNGEAADIFLKRNLQVEHIVIVDDAERPAALLTRQHFYNQTGGPFGYSLIKRRDLEHVAKRDFLKVMDRMPVTTLARLAMNRAPDDLYDPVVVVDDKERLLGTVTMKQLVERSSELQLNAAIGANPLTNLPGNRAIHSWLQQALREPEFSIVYADLDRFKEYNDSYGFLMGDEMLQLAANVLREGLEHLDPEAKLGNVGGDDFIIVSHRHIGPGPLLEICRAFDASRKRLFKPEHIEQGFYESVNRQGRKVRVKPTSISLAAINSDVVGPEPHPAMLAQIAASLKKKIKEITAESGKSWFFLERRKHLDRPGDDSSAQAKPEAIA